jgi:GT2 family glycosyltransferase
MDPDTGVGRLPNLLTVRKNRQSHLLHARVFQAGSLHTLRVSVTISLIWPFGTWFAWHLRRAVGEHNDAMEAESVISNSDVPVGPDCIAERDAQVAISPPAVQKLSPNARPVVRDGKFLRAGCKRFYIRGVTYGTFRPNEQGEPYPPFRVLQDDFYRMREVGVNTVRLYTPPSDRIADAAAKAGLFLVPDICWGPRWCELDDAERMAFMRDWIRGHARRLAGHPAILMYSLGNEIPPLLVRWYGRKRIESFLRELRDIAVAESPNTLVTYVNHPPTESLDLPFLDVVSYNVYLEREPEFRAYVDRLQMLAGDRPLFLAEIGLDSRAHGEGEQAKFLNWQLRAVFEKGLCGAAVYSWTDEWQIFDSAIEGWAFGVTEADRQPKLGLSVLREVFHLNHNQLRPGLKPLVSVIVCAHNATATIEECLRSLSRLRYPNYEIIVVDDGSTDGTGPISAACGARLIRIERGGLSRARNTGIKAARGSILAFIDADAYADPDWLTFAVATLERNGAAAVGGPNLCPPTDGFVAQCVDLAPGNPTHVLLDETSAEHIPGCNMIFRKSALEQIGLFDVTHRAAGDDVDVCWKLLARQQIIAFSPSAVVWHHRRGTVSGFLKQQRGYGFAEAHLHNRYCGHYNVFGYAVWRGRVYDAPSQALCGVDFPVLIRSRVYQGQFCSAQFQSIYEPFQRWWFQIFTTIEWMGLAGAVCASAAVALFLAPLAAAGLIPLAAAMWGSTLGCAMLASWQALRAKRWSDADAKKARRLVAFLHLAQPLARAWGRLKGWWALRDERIEYPASTQLYGNLSQRDTWLRRLHQHARGCGWVVRTNGDWESFDVEMNGPGPLRLTLTSVYEEDLEHAKHYVRYRIQAKWKPFSIFKGFLVAVLLGLCLTRMFLWPLAVPLGFAMYLLFRARRIQTAALSQLAMECAEPLGMVPVNKDA